jgi:hypothetical protein
VTADARGREESTDCVDDATLTLPLHLYFPFYRPDRTGLHCTGLDLTDYTTSQPHLTSLHTNQRRNKAIDTHTNEAEAEDAEQESIAQLYLYVMYVCMYTTRRMGVPEHELSQGAELHFLFDHNNCPAFVNLRRRWIGNSVGVVKISPCHRFSFRSVVRVEDLILDGSTFEIAQSKSIITAT